MDNASVLFCNNRCTATQQPEHQHWTASQAATRLCLPQRTLYPTSARHTGACSADADSQAIRSRLGMELA
jgi:hypothetical protein